MLIRNLRWSQRCLAGPYFDHELRRSHRKKSWSSFYLSLHLDDILMESWSSIYHGHLSIYLMELSCFLMLWKFTKFNQTPTKNMEGVYLYIFDIRFNTEAWAANGNAVRCQKIWTLRRWGNQLTDDTLFTPALRFWDLEDHFCFIYTLVVRYFHSGDKISGKQAKVQNFCVGICMQEAAWTLQKAHIIQIKILVKLDEDFNTRPSLSFFFLFRWGIWLAREAQASFFKPPGRMVRGVDQVCSKHFLNHFETDLSKACFKKKVISVRFACVPVSLPLTCIPFFNLVGLNLELRPPRRKGATIVFFAYKPKKGGRKRWKTAGFFPWFPTSSTSIFACQTKKQPQN